MPLAGGTAPSVQGKSARPATRRQGRRLVARRVSRRDMRRTRQKVLTRMPWRHRMTERASPRCWRRVAEHRVEAGRSAVRLASPTFRRRTDQGGAGGASSRTTAHRKILTSVLRSYRRKNRYEPQAGAPARARSYSAGLTPADGGRPRLAGGTPPALWETHLSLR